jgi:hypothetical protein
MRTVTLIGCSFLHYCTYYENQDASLAVGDAHHYVIIRICWILFSAYFRYSNPKWEIQTYITLVLYDAVNRNKVSIRQLPPFFIFLLTHYMFRPQRAIFR